MEPSFWSWEKAQPDSWWVWAPESQWSPAFGAGKSVRPCSVDARSARRRNGAQLLELGKAGSWSRGSPRARLPRRNGAQLLELGKESRRVLTRTSTDCRNGAQLLELGKGPAIAVGS